MSWCALVCVCVCALMARLSKSMNRLRLRPFPSTPPPPPPGQSKVPIEILAGRTPLTAHRIENKPSHCQNSPYHELEPAKYKVCCIGKWYGCSHIEGDQSRIPNTKHETVHFARRYRNRRMECTWIQCSDLNDAARVADGPQDVLHSPAAKLVAHNTCSVGQDGQFSMDKDETVDPLNIMVTVLGNWYDTSLMDNHVPASIGCNHHWPRHRPPILDIVPQCHVRIKPPLYQLSYPSLHVSIWNDCGSGLHLGHSEQRQGWNASRRRRRASRRP